MNEAELSAALAATDGEPVVLQCPRRHRLAQIIVRDRDGEWQISGTDLPDFEVVEEDDGPTYQMTHVPDVERVVSDGRAEVDPEVALFGPLVPASALDGDRVILSCQRCSYRGVLTRSRLLAIYAAARTGGMDRFRVEQGA